jgi:sulfur dioxygenase
MKTEVRNIDQMLIEGERAPAAPWKGKAVQSEDCLSYIVWNELTREALIIDPKREDAAAYTNIVNELKNYRWLGVIDTHTHADHVSMAAELANNLRSPLIMHADSPSKKVDIRVSRSTTLSSAAGNLRFLMTPGHTQDSITVIWGPYLFGGDTILFGDVGRDDLPGGSPELHYESVQLLKAEATPELIILPGHDHKGGRASSWATQLKVNTSLTQARAEFISEAASFEAPAPRLLKESLRENFR